MIEPLSTKSPAECRQRAVSDVHGPWEMSLLRLPNELLLAIGDFLGSERDINALARCCGRLYNLLNRDLYRYNARHSCASALAWAAEQGRTGTLKLALLAVGGSLQDSAPLLAAAKNGHRDCVDILLATPGVYINGQDKESRTALSAASECGHIEVVELLLAKGAVIWPQRCSSCAPLSRAVSNEHWDVAKVLLEHGANVYESASCLARFAEACGGVVTLLMGHSACDEIVTRDGWTMLPLAVRTGEVDAVKALIASGADVNFTVNGRTVNARTPLHLAVESGSGVMIELLVDHGACPDTWVRRGLTPLQLAIRNGRVDSVKLLIGSGADVNLVGGLGWTPIRLASDRGHEEIVRLLLNSGADVKSGCGKDLDALRLAARGGYAGVVELLLAHGADTTTTDEYGCSALHFAAEYHHADAVEVLLRYGADHSATDLGGRTALYLASEHGNVEVVERLLAGGADYTIGDEQGWTGLHRAAHQGHSDVVELFVKTPGIYANLPDPQGRTAFHFAAMRGRIEVLNVLLAHRVSALIPDCNGWLPLHAAIRCGREKAARSLLLAGGYVAYFGGKLLALAARSSCLGYTSPSLVLLVHEHVQRQRQDDARPRAADQGDEPADVDETTSGCVEGACWCRICKCCRILTNVFYQCIACDPDDFGLCEECYVGAKHPCVRHPCVRRHSLDPRQLCPVCLT
ncbi:hypothetical protein E4U41_004191 [Claviceps citrina]|nr:hypothetical protein E4U41_004191 [Claviceps citrina]